MDEFLGLSYKLIKSENFDEYMKALGIGIITRKIGSSVSPVVKLTKNGGVYTLLTTSTFKNQQINFQPDVEFDEETPDGRKVKAIINIEGNKMIHTQRNGNVTTTITREFKPNEMVSILSVGDVVCTRTYEKLN